MKRNKKLHGWLTLLVGLAFLLLHGVSCYPPLKCPAREQWAFRAHNCSNQDGYICLLDINTGLYRETCISDKQKEITPGYKRVFAGNLHGISCANDRYQPFTFWTNGYSDCIYKKSTCSEEGQVLYDIGYHTTDSLCRCDYNHGYDFVTTPKNRCYCMPQEEDCSCYQKTCSPGQLLTQDYECKDAKNWPISFVCPVAPYISNTLKPPVDMTSTITDTNHKVTDFNKLRTIPIIVFMTIVVVIILMVILIVCFAFERKVRVTECVYVNVPLPPDPEEMPKNIRDLQDQETKKWNLELNHFVSTNASNFAKKLLKEHQVIVITGPAGCGKSVTARNLVLDMVENEEHQLLIVYSPDDIFRYAKMDGRQIIFIDDIFGKYTVGDFEHAWWQKQHERLTTLFSKNDSIKVVATSRSDVFLEMDYQRIFSFGELSFLSAKTRLLIGERREIGKMYHEATLDILDDKLIDRYDFFPAICASNKFPDVIDEIKCPLNFIEFEANKLYENKSIKLFAIALVVLYNNSLNEEQLDICFSKDMDMLKSLSRDLDVTVPSKLDITRSLNVLIGSYLLKENSTYSFTCEQFFTIFMYHTSKFILFTLLKFGKSLLLKDKIMFESLQCPPQKLMIIVPKQHEEAYFDRLQVDLKTGVFLNTFLDMQNQFKSFRASFITYLQRQKLKSSDLQNAPDKKTVIHAVAEAGYIDYLDYFLRLDNNRINQGDYSARIPLHFAAMKGHTEMVNYLIKKGSQIMTKDKDNKSPLELACIHNQIKSVKALAKHYSSNRKQLVSALCLACEKGNLEIVKILIEFNAPINGNNMMHTKPLHLAAKGGHNLILEHLLSNNADKDAVDRKNNATALFYVSGRNNTEGVIRLLRHKANPNIVTEDGNNCLHASSEKGYAEVTKLLIKAKTELNKRNKVGNTPLYLACLNNHKDVVTILLQNNADPNLHNNYKATPLHVSARKGWVDIVEELINHKANINSYAKNTETPLFYACREGQIRVIDSLLKKGADVSLPFQKPMKDYSGKDVIKTVSHVTNNVILSPLIVSCEKNKLDVVNMLLRYNADIEQRDQNGNTPLHIAARHDNVELMRTLIANNAKIENRNDSGETPLFVAVNRKSMMCIELLVQTGADVNTVNNLNVSIISQNTDSEIFTMLQNRYQNGANTSYVRIDEKCYS